MKQIIESFFSQIPEPVQVVLYGQYRDAAAACDSHPHLVAGLIEQLQLPPSCDGLRAQMTTVKEQLATALEQVAKA